MRHHRGGTTTALRVTRDGGSPPHLIRDSSAVERLPVKQMVGGSIPPLGATVPAVRGVRATRSPPDGGPAGRSRGGGRRTASGRPGIDHIPERTTAAGLCATLRRSSIWIEHRFAKPKACGSSPHVVTTGGQHPAGRGCPIRLDSALCDGGKGSYSTVSP